jgi:2-oxoglutarate dehydrogenase E1 component
MGYQDDIELAGVQADEGAGLSPGFVEALYARYLADPNSVDPGWIRYFAGLEKQVSSRPSWVHKSWPLEPADPNIAALDPTKMALEPKDIGKNAVKTKDKAVAAQDVPSTLPSATPDQIRQAVLDSIRALMLVRLYRVRGHLVAKLDPLGLEKRVAHPELDPRTHGFQEQDWDRPIFLNGTLGLEHATVREIVALCQKIYCGHIGFEFMHINDPAERDWIIKNIEGRDKEVQFTKEGKTAILNKLVEAEGIEKFLARKYVGTKRFGLDGGEAMIPALEAVIKTGGALGVRDIVLGMPHRGRLSVLTNVMQKPYRQLFYEFAGGSSQPDDIGGSGDVKYHLGASTDRLFDGNKVHLSLTPNPSHLEAVNPVVLGKVRAKQLQTGDRFTKTHVLPLLLHGDAAFAGQGIVAECFAMSGVPGYNAGGTIHFIVNNQIGFTTSPVFARSSPYPSDVAKMVQAPIFHVNGDDPEAVVYVTKLATQFRQEFKRDVVVDMFCYRRFGHNESDEPSFTQPLMYKAIKTHRFVSVLYAEQLVREGVITPDYLKMAEESYAVMLEEEFAAASSFKVNKADRFEGAWAELAPPSESVSERRSAQTGVALEDLRAVGQILTHVPEGFNIHKTLARVLEAKAEALRVGEGLDWATAEGLAFGTLLKEDFGIRLSGQDVGRGTFSHRHAIWTDQVTEAKHTPFSAFGAKVEIFESVLSEYGVMGYEYGFSIAEPNWLTMWEAQFGDFANGAQIMIDQFIAAGETKWLRSSGLVLLLPHGYEGQGPEHSSARLERFLQLCAEDNIQVANCTTPANYFHILRRQMLRAFRKPLIIMTPKSLLRHKKAVSRLEDFGPESRFHRVLFDDAEIGTASSLNLKADIAIKRLVVMTGKVYYDVLEERDRRAQDDTYLLRLEQLYPYPCEAVVEVVKRFPALERVVWCQEEPKNAGAWSFIEPLLEESLSKAKSRVARAVYAGRNAAAATATGYAKRHAKEQAALVEAALSL